MPGAGAVFVIAHAVAKVLTGQAAVAQEELVIIENAVLGAALFVEDYIVKANAIALRVDVQFAGGVGLVAALAKGLSQGRQVGHFQGFFKDSVAVGARRRARH